MMFSFLLIILLLIFSFSGILTIHHWLLSPIQYIFVISLTCLQIMDELIYLMFPGGKWASLASLLDEVALIHHVVESDSTFTTWGSLDTHPLAPPQAVEVTQHPRRCKTSKVMKDSSPWTHHLTRLLTPCGIKLLHPWAAPPTLPLWHSLSLALLLLTSLPPPIFPFPSRSPPLPLKDWCY